MFKIDMTVAQNYASFRDTDTEREVIVESFDNVEFDVFLLATGVTGSSEKIGTIVAHTDVSLVYQLMSLVGRITNN